MSDEIMLVFGEDGIAREYDDTWDVTIHCESEEEQKTVLEKLNNSNQEVKTSRNLISRQALCEYALNQKNKSVTPNDIMRFPSAQPEPLSDAYMNSVWTWLIDYQIKVAELKGRYTPYEILGWIVSDWRKENGIW